MPIQSVEPRRLYRQIADQVRGLIEAGEFGAGARLPAERDLALQLGVSRPSVREALIALEVEGWVEVRTGSGVYVRERPGRLPRDGAPSAAASNGPRGSNALNGSTGPHAPNGHPVPTLALPRLEWGPLELIRARRVVEGETAALAARLARRKDLQAIADAIAWMREMADREQMPTEGDRAFHVAIVEACGNAVLSETVQGYWDSRRGPIFTRLGGHFETVPSWRAAIGEHEAIQAAIAARDPAAARAAMHAHMDRAHRRFNASWRRAHDPSRPLPHPSQR